MRPLRSQLNGNRYHLDRTDFRHKGYEVIDNVIKSGGQAIHCWRHSAGGVIEDNLRIGGNTSKPVVTANSPKGWQAPNPPPQNKNRNQLSDR